MLVVLSPLPHYVGNIVILLMLCGIQPHCLALSCSHGIFFLSSFFLDAFMLLSIVILQPCILSVQSFIMLLVDYFMSYVVFKIPVVIHHFHYYFPVSHLQIALHLFFILPPGFFNSLMINVL